MSTSDHGETLRDHDVATDHFVEIVDVTPTSLEIRGRALPAAMYAHSLVPLLLGETTRKEHRAPVRYEC